jgi:transcriptional regulator with XRE-family HTH domain
MAHKRERLRRVRRSAGLSQEDLAHRLGVATSTVWRWEAGETEPDAWQQPRLAKLLGVTRAELVRLLEVPPSLPPAADSAGASMSAPDSSLDGNEARHSKAGDDDQAVLASSYVESVALNQSLEGSSLGSATLEQLSVAVENFGSDYLHVPPAQTLRDAAITRRFVIRALDGKQTLRRQRELYAIGGWLSALIGHGSFDLGGSFGVIDSHLTTALRLAHEIDQTQLIAWAHGTQALAAVFRDRPQVAIECAQAGLVAARDRSIMRVRLLAQEARGHARLGDGKRAEHCMAAAETVLGSVADPLSTSIFSFDRPYLPYYAGTCYAWLKRPRLAARQSREAITLCDRAPNDWPVARVLARIDLGEALLQQHEPEDAAALARECLDICVYGRRTAPMEHRLRDFLVNLTAALGTSKTRDLADQFHTLFRDGVSSAHGS